MNPTPACPAESTESPAREWLLRAFAVLVYLLVVPRIAMAWWVDQSRWTLLLMLVTEGYTLLMLLFARRAIVRDLSPLAIVASIYACFFYLLFSMDGLHLVAELTGVALQTLGLFWQFAAKATLGRSFGVLPARRGLVTSGPYRLVRHPIYFGYLISHIGFLLVNFCWQNLAVLVLLYVAQIHRMRREEAVLSEDAAYRSYQARVRWRLLPLVY